MVCEYCSVCALCLTHSQQVDRNTPLDENPLGTGANESAVLRRVTSTLSAGLTAAHSTSGVSHQFAIDCTNTSFGTVLQEPTCSHLQLASRYDEEAGPIRSRSTSSATTPEERYRSFYPSAVHKRYGIIGLSGSDGMFGDYQSFFRTLDADEEHGVTSTNEDLTDLTAYEDISAAEPRDQVACDHSVHAFDAGSPLSEKDYGTRPLIDNGTHDCPPQREIEGKGVANSRSLPCTGKWRCCGCQRGHDIYRLGAGEHLISTLSCLCKHRSCRSCAFQGTVKQFAPIDDVTGVATIPVASDDGKNNQFGVVCRTCGLSWRAETVKKPKVHTLSRRRLSLLSMVNPLQTIQQLRRSRSMLYLGLSQNHRPGGARPPSGSLTSHSSMNLRSTSGLQTKGAKPKPKEQAQGAEVSFHSIECTCGTVTDSTSLCFQLVNTHETDGKVTGDGQGGKAPKAARRCGTPDLRAKGYGTPTLHLKGGPHPNPLRSNPVEKSWV